MQRTITIKGRTGIFDTPSFLLSENEDLTIVFSFREEIRVGRYHVVVRHGNAPKKSFILSSDKSVLLSAEWLNEGGTEPVEFDLQLLNASGTAVIKSDYHIESLIITESDGKWTATAEMQKLTERMQTLETKNKELEARLKELLSRVEAYETNGILPEEIE